jgi:hypothetical protein
MTVTAIFGLVFLSLSLFGNMAGFVENGLLGTSTCFESISN